MSNHSKGMTPAIVLTLIQKMKTKFEGSKFDTEHGMNFTEMKKIQKYGGTPLWDDLFRIYMVVQTGTVDGKTLDPKELQQFVLDETEVVAKKLEESVDLLRTIFFAWSDLNHGIAGEKVKPENKLENFSGVTADYRF